MNILVAVDDSEFADYVAEFVVAHTWPADSHITVLTVLPSLLPLAAALPPPILQDLGREQYIAAGQLLQRVASMIEKCGYEVSQKTAAGNPKQEILTVAKALKADAIVVGSHGRSGFEKIMLGSVSLAVASRARCSVLIVRPPTHARENFEPEEVSVKELAS